VVFTPNAGKLARVPAPGDQPQPATPDLRDSLAGAGPLDLVGILSAADETAYVWNLSTGRIDWEVNALDILGIPDLGSIATGAAYHALIAPEHLDKRLAMFARSVGADRVLGVPYRVQYRLRPAGRRREIHVEDHGRWWPGADGHPVRARGLVRLLPEDYLAQQRALRSDLDELTGQLNRLRLTQALGAVVARAERSNSSCAFVVLSVNNLSVINDTFGIEVGDQVIAEVGRRIRAKLRVGDVIGRYSSNKFGVVLPNCSQQAMCVAAERFLQAVRGTPIKTFATNLTATVSAGGVIVPEQARSIQDAVTFSSRALDLAKSKRCDCFVPYEPSLAGDRARLHNRSIAESVIAALDDNRMRLVLQPMISTKSGRPEIYEALLRMQRPDGTLLAAGHFVPIAEQLGLSRLIDRRTLELSLDLLKRHQDLTLAINVSGLTCSDHEWLTALRRLTDGHPGILQRIIVEITETVALEELDQSANFVDTLTELGCRVAIDDFGAGYTSFKNLKRLNVGLVKIDGAFIKNLAEDESDQIFVKTMVELANSLGMETVAEWVGDERAARFLKDAGITYMQGFYYGMPFESSDYDEAA
jgi:diguanylate cyclase (GGDEF)-like protein